MDCAEVDEDFPRDMEVEDLTAGPDVRRANVQNARMSWKRLGQHLAEGTLFTPDEAPTPPSPHIPHPGWSLISQRFLDGTLSPERSLCRVDDSDGWAVVSKHILDGTLSSMIDHPNGGNLDVESAEGHLAHFKAGPNWVGEDYPDDRDLDQQNECSFMEEFSIEPEETSQQAPLLREFLVSPTSKRLGGGSFGVVFEGRTTGSTLPEVVAIKQIKTADPAFAEALEHEADMVWALQDNPNIVRLFGRCLAEGSLALVFELGDSSLADFVAQFQTENGLCAVPPEVTFDISHQIASGMDYVHSQGILHLDLKPENLLTKRGGSSSFSSGWVDQMWPVGSKVLITDFEHAVHDPAIAHGHSIEFHGKGTPYYMSPEAIVERRCSTKSDVWAFALIEWQLLTGRKPYVGLCGDAILYNVGLGRKPTAHDWPAPFSTFLPSAFSSHDLERPSFADVLEILRNSSNDFCRIDPSAFETQQLAWWRDENFPQTGHA